MIRFENVNVKYIEQFSSLLNFSFSFNESCLLIGDEISGPNTVLRLLAKFDKDYTGNIFIDDVNIKKVKDKNLDIVFVSKIPYLFNNKSLNYNLGYGLKIRKINKKIIENEVNNIIFKYNLQNLNKKIKLLTNSEKKIVSLLRAVVRKPKYLLLEYFFEDLDEQFLQTAKQIISDALQTSVVIACEKTNINLFGEIKKHEFNFGSLN